MAAGADGEARVREASGARGRGDVVGVARVSDGRRPPVDRARPAGAGLVVAGIAGLDDAGDEALGSQAAASEEPMTVLMPRTVPRIAPAGIGQLPYLRPLSTRSPISRGDRLGLQRLLHAEPGGAALARGRVARAVERAR